MKINRCGSEAFSKMGDPTKTLFRIRRVANSISVLLLVQAYNIRVSRTAEVHAL